MHIITNFLKFYFEIKVYYLYPQKNTCIIHNHSFDKKIITCNLIYL